MKLALLPKKTRGGTVIAQLGLRWGDESSKMNRSTACGIASAMLLRGTQKKTREQIRNEFDRLKATVGVGSDGGSIDTVRDNLPATLRLVAEVLRQPSFPESEFEQLRRSALTSIDAQRSDPGALAGIALSRHLSPSSARALALQRLARGAQRPAQGTDACGGEAMLCGFFWRLEQRARGGRGFRSRRGHQAGGRAVRRLDESAPLCAHSAALSGRADHQQRHRHARQGECRVPRRVDPEVA